MGAVDAPQQSSSKGRKGKKRKTRRVGFKLDMTPMVDVAFLLLTFFMLTTTFNKPNTMEINVPPENMEVEVAESNVMTLRVVENDSVFWNIANDAPTSVNLYDKGGKGEALSQAFQKVLESENEKNNNLVVVIKLDKKAKYRNLVDVIDELNLMKIDRFSLADFAQYDSLEIEKSRQGIQPGEEDAKK
ncbi:Biopolymer transport protein ExbD/TolR [Chloroherpeton thalassium ATCC 35110]|uniref:Biopolymer transport protein ExbD/TolR n=1 Tax=Chloroherpeton thalassium (strain ATCC 35110 / GB-78) TaxID=517418 RepID=B3QWM0_CHLT3|nr:biopolymer transporter ExbD [Chloroherpeton thalassium]ACF14780.1 Biopolymer transport protein ExbD/TolR [Chloroherpeton thalassium ATCC 35110]